MATIEIFVTAQGAAAQRNHDSEDRGQTVTWIFTQGMVNHRVVFTGFQPPGPLGGPSATISPPPPNLFSTNPNLVNVGGRIDATIDDNATAGHYFYEISDGNKLLPWLNPLPGLSFGGLDVPKGPP